MKFKMSKLVEMVGDLAPFPEWVDYTKTEQYLKTLFNYGKGLTDIEVEEEELPDGTFEEWVNITHADMDLLEEYVETFGSILAWSEDKDNLTEEDWEELNQSYDYEDCDLERMKKLLRAIEKRVEENNAPKGVLLEDGWYDVNENFSVWCQDGEAVYGIMTYGFNDLDRVYPYKYSNLEGCYVGARVWATVEDIEEAHWN